MLFPVICSAIVAASFVDGKAIITKSSPYSESSLSRRGVAMDARGRTKAVRQSVDRQGVGGDASGSTVERGKQLREQKNGKQLRNCCNSSKLPPNQAPLARGHRLLPAPTLRGISRRNPGRTAVLCSFPPPAPA